MLVNFMVVYVHLVGIMLFVFIYGGTLEFGMGCIS